MSPHAHPHTMLRYADKSGVLWKKLCMPTPAFNTRMSMVPYVWMHVSMSALHCSSLVTSVATAMASLPALLHSATTASSGSRCRAANTRRQRRRAYCNATSRPMPDDAPVTTMTELAVRRTWGQNSMNYCSTQQLPCIQRRNTQQGKRA
jgi:hypothetical protein